MLSRAEGSSWIESCLNTVIFLQRLHQKMAVLVFVSRENVEYLEENSRMPGSSSMSEVSCMTEFNRQAEVSWDL